MAQHTARDERRRGAGSGLGAVLLVLGILFLAQQTVGFAIPAIAYPLGIVAIGACFFVAMVVGGMAASGLAIPGSVVTTVGLILTYQDHFGRYETWSYAWALIVVAVGVGLLIKGFWTDDPKAFQAGLRVAGIGAVLFVVFGAFFEVALGLGGLDYASASHWFWPVLMILVGSAILLGRGRDREPR
jgi:hypothetical protein